MMEIIIYSAGIEYDNKLLYQYNKSTYLDRVPFTDDYFDATIYILNINIEKIITEFL